MMNFVAGAEIPERYVPFLKEELALESSDVKSGHWAEDIPASVKQSFRVLIIGAGMSGMLAAIRLKQAGIPFTIVEKNSEVGGTWFENTYPGCRVDNPNHLYSYSFEPNHDWPQHFSTQAMLLAYFRGVAKKYGLRQHIRFDTEVVESAFDEAAPYGPASAQRRARGDDRSQRGDHRRRPAEPAEISRHQRPRDFKGPSFHSGAWHHYVDLKGKRVAVIGTGASAFQFVPEIADEVGSMVVFQRTPPWLGPTPDYHEAVGEGQKWLLKHVPFYGNGTASGCSGC